MTGHEVTIALVGPVATFGERSQVEDFFDQVMDHLLDCDVVDPIVGESYSDDESFVRVEFSMGVKAAEAAEAVTIAMAAIRTSFHALGTGTPGWEQVIRYMRSEASAATSLDNENNGPLVPA